MWKRRPQADLKKIVKEGKCKNFFEKKKKQHEAGPWFDKLLKQFQEKKDQDKEQWEITRELNEFLNGKFDDGLNVKHGPPGLVKLSDRTGASVVVSPSGSCYISIGQIHKLSTNQAKKMDKVNFFPVKNNEMLNSWALQLTKVELSALVEVAPSLMKRQDAGMDILFKNEEEDEFEVELDEKTKNEHDADSDEVTID